MSMFNKKLLMRSLIFGGLLFLTQVHPAFAALENSIEELQGRVETISIPLAIIFLIIAGWQKAMGNNHLFIAALVGTVIIFAAPQLVSFISTSFGG